MLSDLVSWELRASREFSGDTIQPSFILITSSPMALIIPAKTHPEVIVQAVAARNRDRAEEFAKSHGIPEVKNSYQGKLIRKSDIVSNNNKLLAHLH